MVCKAGAGRVLPRRTEEEGASTQAPHHHNTMIPPPANSLTSASDVLQQASRRLCGGARGEVGLIVVFVGDGAESGERRSFFAHSVGPRFPRPLPLSSHMAALRATAAALVGVGAVLTARRRGERGRGKGNDWRARRSPPPRPPPLPPPLQRTATLRAMLGRRQLRPTQTCLFKTHPPPFPFPTPQPPPRPPLPPPPPPPPAASPWSRRWRWTRTRTPSARASTPKRRHCGGARWAGWRRRWR